MSIRLTQDLHAAISRRDWSAVELAANRLRDEVEKTIAILAGTSIGSLPNDYPLSKLAADAAAPSPSPNVSGNQLPEELLKLTFAVQHNPNCPSPFLVRLGGEGPIDMKPYGDGLGLRPHQTGDILGFGKTLEEAGRAALAATSEGQG